MWCALVLSFFFMNLLIEIESVSKNDTGLLISRYAKVSHYRTRGNGQRIEAQANRNNSGNIPSNHRSETGREINNNKGKIAYQYPVYSKPSSKVDYGKVEAIPSVGEVIQSRFQAKPYFDYGKIPPKNSESATFAPANPIPATPVRQAPPPPPSGGSFPAVFNVAPQTPKPPVDLYTSIYSSYNPPPLQQDTSSDSFPPDSYAAPPDSYAAPPPSDGGSYNYKPAPQVSTTFGPPLAPVDNQSGAVPQDMVDALPSVHDNHDHGDHDDGPPDYPPKNEDDIYYPPGVPHDDVPHLSDHGSGVSNQAPMDVMGSSDTMMKLEGMEDHPKDLADNSPYAQYGGHFPNYLYDNPHYNHHVYEEIPHTTTPAPATEDKRVSSTNYSYYYLGRKLWYIPLYFSIYFMIYVTVLILKAIARHKVEFKNNWVEANSRSGRQMTFKQLEAVDDLHRNISEAVDRVSRSYSHIAM